MNSSTEKIYYENQYIKEFEAEIIEIRETGGKVYISGRSNGKINVQVILEKLGGGGHMLMAGAQIQGMSIEEVKKMLIQSIEETLKEKE